MSVYLQLPLMAVPRRSTHPGPEARFGSICRGPPRRDGCPAGSDNSRERRGFLGLIGGVAAWPLVESARPSLAQTPNRVYRLAHLANSAPSEVSARQVTLPELARLGFVEGAATSSSTRVWASRMMGELLARDPTP